MSNEWAERGTRLLAGGILIGSGVILHRKVGGLHAILILAGATSFTIYELFYLLIDIVTTLAERSSVSFRIASFLCDGHWYCPSPRFAPALVTLNFVNLSIPLGIFLFSLRLLRVKSNQAMQRTADRPYA